MLAKLKRNENSKWSAREWSQSKLKGLAFGLRVGKVGGANFKDYIKKLNFGFWREQPPRRKNSADAIRVEKNKAAAAAI